MKTKFRWFLIVMGGAAMTVPVQANPPSQSNASSHAVAARPAPRASTGNSYGGYRGAGAGPSFRPASVQNYGGSRPTYSSGQRFSPTGPRMTGISDAGYRRGGSVQNFGGSRPTYSNRQRFSSMSTSDATWRQTFPRSNFQRGSNSGAITSSDAATRNGSGFDRTSRGSRGGTSFDRTRTRPGIRETDGRDRVVQSGGVNRTTSAGTQNHVFATRSANWQPNWDKNCDQWWNGHRCRFINNSWVIFDFGFYPWWPIGYPYDYYYGYGAYPYGYGYDPYAYGYGYDSGYYGDGGYYGQGYGDGGYYGQDGSGAPDQYGDADSPVAAAQARLAREGYYHGRIDGVFGPETQRALRAFQRDHGLNPTGYLTRDTRAALGLRS